MAAHFNQGSNLQSEPTFIYERPHCQVFDNDEILSLLKLKMANFFKNTYHPQLLLLIRHSIQNAKRIHI